MSNWITLKPRNLDPLIGGVATRLGDENLARSIRFERMRVHTPSSSLDVALHLETAPADRQLFDALKQTLKDTIPVARAVCLDVRYPAAHLSAEEYTGLHFEDLKDRLSLELGLSEGWLDLAAYEMEGGMRGGSMVLLVENDLVLQALEERRGRQALATLVERGSGEKLEIQVRIGDFEAQRREKEARVEAETPPPEIAVEESRPAPVPRPQAPAAGGNGHGNGNGKKPGVQIIKGRPLDQAKISPIRSLNEESAAVVVEGEVFATDLRETKKGRAIFKVAVTDGEDSIQGVMWLDKPADAPPQIKKGARLRLRGPLKQNAYENFELELDIKDASLVPPVPRRIDKAPAGMRRVELHAHTKMSAADSVVDVESYIKRAAEWGHPAVAVTDHGVVHAFPKAAAVAKKAGIKLLLGCEAYLVHDVSFLDKRGKEKLKPPQYYHIIILVKNEKGRKALYDLVSHSHLETYYRKPLIHKELLEQKREHLILGSACEAGELFQAIQQGKAENEIREVASFYDYLEVQTPRNNQFMIRNGEAKDEEELQGYVRKIVSLGEELGKPVVATSDLHFLDPEDEVYRRIMQTGNGMQDAENQAPLFFHTTDEMMDEFPFLPEEKRQEIVVQNTQLVASWCELVPPVPDGRFFPEMDGAEDSVRLKTWEKARLLYGDPLHPFVDKRVKRELDSIIGNRFSVLYEIARRLVAESNRLGYMVGSRGSVGSSVVAYLLGITEVNPLPAHYRCPQCKHAEFDELERLAGVDLKAKNCPNCEGKVAMDRDGYNIPFETFVGFKGDKVPDIDLNFAPEVQGHVQKYARDLFGEGKAFKAGTISTLAEKTAWGYVKNYYVNRGENKRRVEFERIKSGLEGVKRTSGQHPGGVILVRHDNEITDFTPIQYPGDKKEMGGKEGQDASDLYTTHFDYHAIDENLVKLDILGKDDGSAFKHLQELTGISESDVPLVDREAISIFSNHKAMGFGEMTPEEREIYGATGAVAIPEFGTENTRRMLELTKPGNFTELIYISGLSHGTNVWANNAETLIRSRKATLESVISTRDDIMNTLIQKGMDPAMAFKITEKVRKGKASREGFTPEEEAALKAAKAPAWWIESCKKIQYMFPKAHATAYCFTAVRMAWFKVHHPEAFYSAWLTLHAEAADAGLLEKGRDLVFRKMMELRSLRQQRKTTAKDESTLNALTVAYEGMMRGIRFMPVDLYLSHATRFMPVEGERALRCPLIALAGLGLTAAQHVEAERHKGEFKSVEDLAQRAGLNKTVIEKLNESGALKVLPKTNQITLF